jgi:hypothetical protein
MTTMLPVPVAITITPITAAFHAVPIVVLSGRAGKCHTPKTENNQQAENYKAL